MSEHDDDNRMVAATEIQWTGDPLPPAESVDLHTLDADELVNYALDLQLDLQSVRALLHQALSALALANDQRSRLQTRMRALLDELRISRDEVRVLSAQLRATSEGA